MREDLARVLVQATAEMEIFLEEEQVLLFTRYFQEIIAWNEKINLLSRRSSEDVLLTNSIDSLTALRSIPRKEGALLDLGSGGGFPGIPLKIALPEMKVSLLESSRKKTSFLKHIIRTLPLPEIVVIHDRVENLLRNEAYKDAFDVVISKAAFKLPPFLMWGAFFLAPGGILIAMKGENIKGEIEEANQAADLSGLYLADSQPVTLPITGRKRRILIYRKSA